MRSSYDCDTVVVPGGGPIEFAEKKEHRENFIEHVFLKDCRWCCIPMAQKRQKQIRYLALYQVAPVSAVTHIAEVDCIKPKDNKYEIFFKGKPKEMIPHLPVGDSQKAPRGPLYLKLENLHNAKTLAEALKCKNPG